MPLRDDNPASRFPGSSGPTGILLVRLALGKGFREPRIS